MALIASPIGRGSRSNNQLLGSASCVQRIDKGASGGCAQAEGASAVLTGKVDQVIRAGAEARKAGNINCYIAGKQQRGAVVERNHIAGYTWADLQADAAARQGKRVRAARALKGEGAGETIDQIDRAAAVHRHTSTQGRADGAGAAERSAIGYSYGRRA